VVANPIDEEIVKAYKKDPMAEELRKRAGTEPQIHTTPEGYIRYHGKVYVPTSERKRITQQAHGAIAHGHQGRKKTHDRLKRHYYWPQMRQTVAQEINECNQCWLNKPDKHAPYGELQIPETPEKA
jgi:hypothetical protein